MIGQTISHYRILEKLGEGGMGSVWKAEDLHMRRFVALKFLHASEDLPRLLREAQTAGSLNHPNICTVYEVDPERGFLAMEFMEGRTLTEIIGGRPLPTGQILQFALQIGQGLKAAHEKGITHRDIKSGNVVIGSAQAKILDFGLARVTGQEGLTRDGAVAGTPGYMAPEQLRGESVDPRTDIWAFGALLHEMATGHSPVAGPAETLPEGLGRVIRKALAMEPAERYQYVDDMLVDLRAASVRSFPGLTRRRLGIAGGAVFGAGIGGWFLMRGRGSARQMKSIAVLPLRNLSGDPNQEFFSEGMTEALINDMGSISAVRVISSASAMRFKNNSKPFPQVARELAVSHVVEGTVLRAGQKVRITVRLIDAEADTQMWSGNYERQIEDVLSLQSEISRSIAQEIRVQLTPREQRNLSSKRPVNAAAHEAYLRARHFWNLRSEAGLQHAVKLFDEAIRLDPAYAAAYAGKADAYSVIPIYSMSPSPQPLIEAQKAVAKALELDPDSADAHIALGYIKRVYEWDWKGAERHLRHGLDLNPSYAVGWQRLANYLFTVGRVPEALTAIENAHRLDPLSVPIIQILCYVHYLLGNIRESERLARQALEMAPDHHSILDVLAAIEIERGNLQKALDLLLRAQQLRPEYTITKAFAVGVLYRMGRKEESRKMHDALHAAARTGYVPPFQFAIVHTMLGEKDEAFRWLDRAVKERDSYLRLIKVEKMLQPLRSDPRYMAILDKMSLPH